MLATYRISVSLYYLVLVLSMGFPFMAPLEARAAHSQDSQPSPSFQNSLGLVPLGNLIQISAGERHACALTTGGGVKCWGDNNRGQLGNGTTLRSSIPVDVVGLTSGVKAIAMGWNHSCALTVDGGAKCWGYNLFGRLGDGTSIDRNAPVDVVGLTSGVKAIDSGVGHTCALTDEGSVKCWGRNADGRLGNGTTIDSTTPVSVAGLDGGITEITVGYMHACARTTGNAVKCWGRNTDGQLGNGNNSNQNSPVDVSGLANGVTMISAGKYHSCALVNGVMRCWGKNESNQLGDGTTSSRNIPTDVNGLSGQVRAIAAGDTHTCVLTDEDNPAVGNVGCWGANEHGQLGDGTTIDRIGMVRVVNLGDIASDLSARDELTCVVTMSGGAKCWGDNFEGQLGDGTPTHSSTPVQVNGLANTDISHLSAGHNHSCILTNVGNLKCWGSNFGGKLGDGTTVERSSPVDVSGLSSIVSNISVGTAHTCALTSNGGAKCWGSNFAGKLGDGSTVNSSTPVDVTTLTSSVLAIVAGGIHTCAFTLSDGTKCWGSNEYGQLGSGTTQDSSTPVNVSGLGNNVFQIALGGNHSCAISGDHLTGGTAKCWGHNESGQLGDRTTTNRATPTGISNLGNDITSISAGFDFTCALAASGSVKCWGNNTSGKLGDGTSFNRDVPISVNNLSGEAKAISLGENHACALIDIGGTSGTKVKCWGNNASGQLGNGSNVDSNVPVDVSGLAEDVSAIVAGGNHTCALLTDGTLHCWGSDEDGQLGRGRVVQSSLPIDVMSISPCFILSRAHTGQGSDPTASPTNSTGCNSGQYIAGEVITLSATPATDWQVSEWSGTANDSSSATTNSLTMPASNHSVSVVYSQTPPPCYTLSRTHTGQGGDPTASPTNSVGCDLGQYIAGETIALSATPATDWQVSEWSGTANDSSSATTNSLTMPASNHSVSVVYSQTPPPCYTLSRAHTGQGDDPTTSPTNSTGCDLGRYIAGETIALSATPATDWQVSEWSGTDNDSSTATTNSLTMPSSSHSVSVVYSQMPLPCYTLSLNHTGQGGDPTASPPNSVGCGIGQYNASEQIILAASPDNGWQVNSWLGTDDDNSSATTNGLTMPGANHVASVAYGESPSLGDMYESDDSCENAKPILIDGSFRYHTFHAQADVDWGYFQAVAGTKYRIEVSTDIDSIADVNMEIYGGCEASADDSEDPSFNPGIRLEFDAIDDGPVYLRMANFDATLFGETARYKLSVRPLAEADDNKALIILAGRLKGTDQLQSNIDDIATSVYRLFQKNGYEDQHIKFLATNTQLPGYDEAATKATLRLAIIDWAKERLSADGVLTIYMIDHGSPDRFYIDELSGQRVSPIELNEWLNILEEAVPGVAINVFIEACQSGSFIDNENGMISKPGRIVITSTDAVNDAKASRNGAYFSDHFLTALHQGNTLATSFDRARKVAKSVFDLQQSWLDANGNGIANEFEDAARSAERSFANAGTLASNQWAPHIFSVTAPDEIVNFSGTIRADVRDDLKVSQVWAVVYPPDYVTPETIQELQSETLPSINLTPTGVDEIHAGIYPGFTQVGTYRIVINAADNDGLVATPREIAVTIEENELEEIYLPMLLR